MKRLVVLAICMVAISIAVFAYDPASSCVQCHADRQKMKQLGAEALYLDPARVDREVNMKGAPSCVDCHLGDAKAADKEAAHRGLLRPHLMVVGKTEKGQAVERATVGLAPLVPNAERGIAAMIPKPDKQQMQKKGIARVLGLYYHDRDPETFAYSPRIARKTCGKCHAKQVADYNRSSKGLLKNQRADRSFAEQLPGPHNCGAWFGQNYKRLKAETSLPFSPEQNAASARVCNTCHPGCDDCHYKPFAGAGTHSFGRPEAASCYGGMRGSICHAGPMERRRGAGFLRGAYAFPPDELAPDIHAKNGLQCLDCHKPVNHNFGSLANPETRNACQKCHREIVAAMRSSEHARVECESCHVTEVGGYQFTFWGPGEVVVLETPYAKHNNYYGTRDFPTLIRNPNGRWIPVKPFPMAVMNQVKNVKPSKLLFRSIPERTIPGNPAIGEPQSFTFSRAPGPTHDAGFINGTRSGLPGGSKAILWIQMDKLSHALGAARACKTCHASHAQVSHSDYLFYDGRDVTVPFSGSYTVVADEKGIGLADMKNDPITTAGGRKVEDFAPFVLIPTAWNVSGIDFSIPFSETKYHDASRELQDFLKQLDRQPQNARTKLIRAVAYHNLAAAKKMLH